jgi:pyruvate/2-oxoglutarate dehydrogenase complex dihydrolipoamide dehydrogenase (E3) component
MRHEVFSASSTIGRSATLLQRGDDVFRGFDDDLRFRLEATHSVRGACVRHGASVERIEPTDQDERSAFTHRQSVADVTS